MSSAASALRDDPLRSERLAEVLKALAHPLRLRLVAALAVESQHVNQVADAVGAPQAIVSQQLRILRLAGLVRQVRQGGGAVYHLAEPRLQDLLGCLSACGRS